MNLPHPQEPPIAIRLVDVTKNFFPDSPNEIIALDGITMDIYSGEWLYVLGGNGCGKSTLLRTISGQCAPSKGRIIHRDNGRSASFYVDSGGHNDLIPSMTIYENLMLVNAKRRRIPRFRKYHSELYRHRFAETLKRFGLELEKRLDDQAISLSAGQQQAVVAAKVLLSSASILLLDEFTSSLDKKTAPAILRILREHCRIHGVTVVAVTHDYHWIDETADRVALMEAGKVVDILMRIPPENRPLSEAHTEGQTNQTPVREFSADVIMERLYGKR